MKHARVSRDWKSGGVSFPGIGNTSGAALMVALWVLLILSLLISGFAFEMHVEAGVTSYYRKRIKAQYLARAGVEWAKVLLARTKDASEEDIIEEGEEEDLAVNALRLTRGVAVRGLKKELGRGFFTLDVVPEEGRRNVNTLSDDEWKEMLDQSNVPEDRWDELIDCFRDWIDGDDNHRLSGAESDDPFYEEREYECKNAPLNTVDELLMIKGFDAAVVYGQPAEFEDEEPMTGIADKLTVWGSGKVNVNTASREVLLSMLDIDEWAVDAILDGRSGIDGEMGTVDDGFESVNEVVSVAGLPDTVKGKISITDHTYVRVVSVGESQGVRAGIWAVMGVQDGEVKPVFWREETMR